VSNFKRKLHYIGGSTISLVPHKFSLLDRTDIDEDKGEYRSEEQILTPELPSRWVGGTTGAESPGMVVYVRGSVPFARAP
jgi:hypothetical protein